MSCTGGRSRRAAALVLGAGALLFTPACTETHDEESADLVTSVQALTAENGLNLNGINLNGLNLNGINLNGINLNGINLNGVKLEKTTFSGTKANGGVVTGADFVGAQFTGKLSNGQLLTLRAVDRIASAHPDIFFYEIQYLSNATANTWKSLCGTSPSGALLRAIPLGGTWDYTQKQPMSGMHANTPDTFTFACRSYAIAKCVELGYRPWSTVTECVSAGVCKTLSGEHFHQACTRMLRADYCGDGVPHTKDGTQVDVWDAFGIQASVDAGFTFEAEWTPTGARCVEHTRLIGDTDGSSATYISQICPSRWASAQSSYECGGANSMFYMKKGFAVPFIV